MCHSSESVKKRRTAEVGCLKRITGQELFVIVLCGLKANCNPIIGRHLFRDAECNVVMAGWYLQRDVLWESDPSASA